MFPVTGWWRERPHLQRWNSPAHYSLVVSLEAETADIYSMIATELGIVTVV